MKAVILIGGKGTRLRPLTINTPKPVVPVLNRPFMEYMLNYLKQHGVTEAILTLSYLPEVVRDRLGDGSSLGIRIIYVNEEPPLGTAGAVKNAESYLTEPFFVLNGDMLTSIDLTEMWKRHTRVRPKASIALIPVDNPSIYGVVETDEHSMVRRFLEKPKPEQITTNLINAGIYILEPEVLRLVPASTYTMFENFLFPKLLEMKEPILGYPTDTYWVDIGAPDKYLQANQNLLLAWNREVRIGNGSKVDVSAKIEGPVLIGENCEIAAGAMIKGPAVLGKNCTIGEGARVEASVLWDDVKIGRSSSLIKCSLAYRCVIEEECYLVECVLGDDVIIRKGNRLGSAKLWPGSLIGSPPPGK